MEIHHITERVTTYAPESLPDPTRSPSSWAAKLLSSFGEDQDERWGKQLIRISSDMAVVCDESLAIQYHNKALMRMTGHQSGTYVGQALQGFFPKADRSEVTDAFSRFAAGSASGLRMSAAMLTGKGRQHFDLRIVRSRRGDGKYFFYILIREESPLVTKSQPAPKKQVEPFFTGLPIAAWRTDNHLKVTRAFGDLWSDLKIDCGSITDGDLSNLQGSSLPGFFQEIDFCDTMAGLSLHTSLLWKDEEFEVTVEPFLDEKRRIIGTIGILRRAKTRLEVEDGSHLDLPGAVEPTEKIKPVQTTRKIEIGPPAAQRNITPDRVVPQPVRPPRELAPTAATPEGPPAERLSRPEPRALSPDDFVQRKPLGKPSEETLALAN